MPILDLLEILELVCADRVTALTLICLCNAKSGQVDTAKMFSQRTLQLITSNSKIFSAKKYSSLISEAISVAGKVSSHTELNAYQGLRKHFTPPWFQYVKSLRKWKMLEHLDQQSPRPLLSPKKLNNLLILYAKFSIFHRPLIFPIRTLFKFNLNR